MPRRQRVRNPIDGLLVVDKPLHWSSMDVCRRVRRATGGAKVGHAGTLDPLATGVVIVCLGKGTKLVEQLMGQPKVYEAEVDLSAFTCTDDREGPREPVAVSTPPVEADVREACVSFVGNVEQAPPLYSAIHVNGERAYKLARRGEDVQMPTRVVRIDAVEVLSYAWPIASLRITCGRGTYIRSLARDLGQRLGTGGHLASLRRTAVGRYTIETAIGEQRLAAPITQADVLALPGPDVDVARTP